MFFDCRNATTIDISNLDTSYVEDSVGMFMLCNKLTTVYVNEDWCIEADKDFFYDIEISVQEKFKNEVIR